MKVTIHPSWPDREPFLQRKQPLPLLQSDTTRRVHRFRRVYRPRLKGKMFVGCFVRPPTEFLPGGKQQQPQQSSVEGRRLKGGDTLLTTEGRSVL